MDITYRKNKTKEFSNTICKHEYVNYIISHWHNYLWYTAGLGTGVLIMLIIHFNLYRRVCCPNIHILKRIRSCFRTAWRHFIIWFRHFCLGQPGINEYSLSTDNIETVRRRIRINTHTIPLVPLSRQFENQRRPTDWSRLSFLHATQMSQLPRSSLPFTYQPSSSEQLQITSRQSSAQELQISHQRSSTQESQIISEPRSTPQSQLLSSVALQQPNLIHISRQSSLPSPSELVKVNPANIYPVSAQIYTCAISTMIATSTVTPARISSTVPADEDFVTPIFSFKC
ncbi:PREDICTED: uncharacterized protein LOC105454202 isoform X2 [Wasmannia auropunctata]|nr:PREDICTED: uncharacterized protein LOC105454202 isoform X2 [Wasmannia auropunctata]